MRRSPKSEVEGFSVDAEQLSQIAKQRKVGIGASLLRCHRALTQDLALLKMGKPCRTFPGTVSLYDILRELVWQSARLSAAPKTALVGRTGRLPG